MALQLPSLHFPATPSFPPATRPTLPTRNLHLGFNLTTPRSRFSAAKAIEKSKENIESEIAAPAVPEAKISDELGELGAEIKELKKAMSEKGEVDFWSGVAEEINQIEWPPFGKVLGTTGAVIGVIVGSSVVLLTVNAVLAELSDKVFAGRGVQDFFG